jgi:hypothetical protein
MPEPRYFSIPSAVVGGVVLSRSALNWRVRAIGRPDADRVDEFSGRDRRGVADHGDEVALAPGLHLEDREAAVLVVKRHPLNRADERFAGGRRGC